MKILHVLASDKFSGAENVVCQIINMFKDESTFEMAYCSPNGDIKFALEERNVVFLPINKLNLKELKRAVDEYKPDLIHAHDMRASFMASILSNRIPFISHIHGNFSDLNKISIKSLMYSYAAKRAKHVFWVSKSSYDEYVFKDKVQDKSTVLRNVINIDALYQKMSLDTNEYDYDIVYLGRLTYPKNPERLIRVLKMVVEKKKDVKIAIIGSGDLEEKTKSLAKELEIDKNIDFLGFVSNPLKIVHDSKVMVMTSRREGTPICALESLALGTPIVSTPTDGMRELIEDGKAGYLSNDDIVLKEKIYEIVNNEAKGNFLSLNAVERSKKLNNIEMYAQNIICAYK